MYYTIVYTHRIFRCGTHSTSSPASRFFLWPNACSLPPVPNSMESYSFVDYLPLPFPMNSSLLRDPCVNSVSFFGLPTFNLQLSIFPGNFPCPPLVPISKNRPCAGQEASSHVRP